MQTYSNLLKPWKMQQFSRFQKSYNELREMLKKGSKSQSKRFFLLTLLEFIVAIIVIAIGSQVTNLTGLYLNEIDKVITIVALLFTIYFLVDFIFKLYKIRSTLPSYSFLVHFKKARESFKNFFLIFLSTYGVYLIIILNSFYHRENNTSYLLESLENQDFNKVNIVILAISIYCVGFLILIWVLEAYLHKKMIKKIEKNLHNLT